MLTIAGLIGPHERMIAEYGVRERRTLAPHLSSG